jgi:hypothetical protein
MKPSKDKRDVILSFCSNPDAVLNALHQAGWAIVPRIEPVMGIIHVQRDDEVTVEPV